MRLIKTHTTYKIYHFLFLALVVFLPIHGRVVPAIIGLIGLNWILELNFMEKYKRIMASTRSKYLLSFGIIYLLYGIGTLYSSQMHGQDGALFNLEVKLSLWVFPLLFATLDFDKLKAGFENRFLYAYVTGCFISVILIFNNAVFSYFKTDSTDVFYYVKLGFVHHPSYLALYLTFAIAVLLTWIFQHLHGNIFKRNSAILLVLIFQLFIILLSSKAGILATVLVYLLMIGFQLIHRGKRSTILITGMLLVSFLISLSFFPASYSRFYSAESALENEPDVDSQDGSVARVMVWRSSLDIIKHHPLFGVGTGDVEPELMKQYQEENISVAMEKNLDAHNQYLQTAIALGVLGFLALIASLIIPAWYAFRNKHLLYLAFLVIFAFNILVESMMERQGGVVFYALFNSFLFYFAYTASSGSKPKQA